MNINDIPLGRLKEILASDVPLTIVTTEALITRLEQAEAAVARVRMVAAHLKDIRLECILLNDLTRALDGDGRA